uniref:Uncharacterized protein n=2 Tax=Spongospora subterranea TaxID=70186 RepID=A0A0H5QMG0_9EUKA|eukprot:CRZ03184.1 hypothetical protein [Spongospora subterranea]
MYRQFKRPVIIALTKADLCKDEAELISVLTSVRSRMSPTLQFCPHVHPVSSSADSFYDLPELRCTISALESDPKRFTSLINNCAVHILTQRHEQLVSRFQRKCRYITQRSSVWTDLSKKIVDVCTSIVSDIASCRHSLRRLAHLPQPMDNVGPAISAPLTALRTQIGHSLASLQRDMRACFGQNENSVDDDAGETCKSSDFNVYDGFDQVDQEGEMFFTERDITIPVDNILANKTRATNGFNLFVNESNSLSEEVEAFKDQSLAKIRQAEQYLEATLSPSGEDAVGERSIFDKGLTATSAAGVMVATALNPVVGVCAAVTWLAATKLVNRHNFANASDTKEQRRQQRLLGLPLLTLDQVANDVAHLQQASISLQHRAAQDDESIIALRRRLDDLEQTRLSVTSVIDSVN